jgi:hypothetical protein
MNVNFNSLLFGDAFRNSPRKGFKERMERFGLVGVESLMQVTAEKIKMHTKKNPPIISG